MISVIPKEERGAGGWCWRSGRRSAIIYLGLALAGALDRCREEGRVCASGGGVRGGPRCLLG